MQYPEFLPTVRASIHLRYRLIPYLYNLLVNFNRNGEPALRPIVYHCQDDPKSYQQSFEYMIGSALMVAPVYEPNVTKRSVYLPKTFDWYHHQTGEFYRGGHEVEVDAPIAAEGAPAFVKAPSFIPTGKTMQHVGHSPDDVRVVELWPSHPSASATEYKQRLIEDDGVSTKHTEANEYSELELSLNCTDQAITVDVHVTHEKFKPAYDTLWFTLCSANDNRDLVWAQEGKTGKSICKVDDRNRRMIGIIMPWK